MLAGLLLLLLLQLSVNQASTMTQPSPTQRVVGQIKVGVHPPNIILPMWMYLVATHNRRNRGCKSVPHSLPIRATQCGLLHATHLLPHMHAAQEVLAVVKQQHRQLRSPHEDRQGKPATKSPQPATVCIGASCNRKSLPPPQKRKPSQVLF